MSKISLPEPINIPLENSEYIECAHYVYNNFLKDDFFNINNRNKLKGKFIFVDMKKESWINGLPERYWHIISFQDSLKYTMDPCIDLTDKLLCKPKKKECSEVICVPQESYSLNGRTECFFRMRRVNRINTIIKLANLDDYRIKIWNKKERIYGNDTKKIFIRYEDCILDHVVILWDYGNMYKFITSYPVSHRVTKKDFDEDYQEYLNNK